MGAIGQGSNLFRRSFETFPHPCIQKITFCHHSLKLNATACKAYLVLLPRESSFPFFAMLIINHALMQNHYNLASQRAIIKPRSVIITTRYFWRKWRPFLGNDLSMLIIEARQRCYRNDNTGETRDWFYSTLGGLGESIGFSAKKVSRLLGSNYADDFIRFKPTYLYKPEIGKKIKGKCLFKVSLDDPLTPEDESKLMYQVVHKDVSFRKPPNVAPGQEVVSSRKRPNGQNVCNNYSTYRTISKYKNEINVTRRKEVEHLSPITTKPQGKSNFETISETLLEKIRNESVFAQGILSQCVISEIIKEKTHTTFIIDTPNSACKTWLERNYLKSLKNIIESEKQCQAEVKLV